MGYIISFILGLITVPFVIKKEARLWPFVTMYLILCVIGTPIGAYIFWKLTFGLIK